MNNEMDLDRHTHLLPGFVMSAILGCYKKLCMLCEAFKKCIAKYFFIKN